jgi:phenylacetic acid degradation operon negative regulatory protein
LRRRLYWIGCGLVSPALWICPDFLADEVEDILDDLDIRKHATLFRAERPRVEGELTAAIAEWWDLEALKGMHHEFLSTITTLMPETHDTSETSPAVAFARYIHGVDAWRVIPYVDPGLPAELLPSDWPGAETTRLFKELSERYAELSWRYVSNIGGT